MDFAKYFQDDPALMKLMGRSTAGVPARTDIESDARVRAGIFLKSTDHFSGEAQSHTVLRRLLEICDDHIWERDPLTEDRISTYPSVGLTRLEVGARTGESIYDVCFFMERLFQLSEEFDVAIDVSNGDENPILVEAAEVLPAWLADAASGQNRVFIYRGSVCIIIPSEMSLVDSAEQAVKCLMGHTDHRHLINKQVTAAVKRRFALKEWLDFPLHTGRVSLPIDFARLLVKFPQLVSVLVEYLPVDPDVNKAVLKGEMGAIPFLSHSTELETVSVGLRFTRLQWAHLRSLTATNVLPTFRKLRNCNLIGQLLMSGLCCAIKRGSRDLIAAAIQAAPPHEKLQGTVISVVVKAMKSLDPALPLPLIGCDPDDSWLFEEPVAPEPESGDANVIDADQFSKEIDRFVNQNGGGEDLSDESSSEGGSTYSEYEEDEEAESFFEEMEREIGKLRIDQEGDDTLNQFMESMNAESFDEIGPASMLFAAMASQDKFRDPSV